MPLPASIRVKISSEEGGYVSITPVVVRDIPPGELVDLLLGLTGKDGARIQEVLRRGSMVSGASRFRWQGWEAPLAEIEELLARFPDDDPFRAFDASRCSRAVLVSGSNRKEIRRIHGEGKRFLRGSSFWSVLMQITERQPPEYEQYDYHSRADRYFMFPPPELMRQIRESADLLPNRAQRQAIRSLDFQKVEFYVERSTGSGYTSSPPAKAN